MLESIRLQDYRNHADTRVALGRLTFLVGPNGSGKSGILEGLHLASHIKRDQAKQVLTGNCRGEYLSRRGQSGFRLTLAGRIGDSRWEWTCAVEPDESFGGEDAVVTEWRLDGEQYDSGFDLQWKLNNDQSIPASQIESQIPETFHYHLNGAQLAAPSYCEEEVPVVRHDGYGLASALAYLMTYEPERFRALEDAVRAVVPAIRRIRVRPSRIRVVEHRAVTVGEQQAIVEEERRVSGQELVLDLVGADALPAHAVNEGSLLVIGLLTVLVSPQRSGMLLLDDVDESLHPAAQSALIREVCNLLASDGELQVVMTGRSPALTEALKARDVWLLEADAGGNAVARCLTDPVDSDAAP